MRNVSLRHFLLGFCKYKFCHLKSWSIDLQPIDYHVIFQQNHNCKTAHVILCLKMLLFQFLADIYLFCFYHWEQLISLLVVKSCNSTNPIIIWFLIKRISFSDKWIIEPYNRSQQLFCKIHKNIGYVQIFS